MAALRSSRVAGAFASVLVAACYDYSLPPGEQAPRTEEAASDPSATASDAAADGDTSTSRCKVGGYYCGGAVLEGRTDTVYRCAAGGTGVLVERCANGCVVSGAGTDDKCSAPTPCHVGGAYCGGDKINGDPVVLYRCLAGGAVEVITRCRGECRVQPGDDDECG